MRVTFFQRDSSGAPATGIVHSVTVADESGGSVTPPTVVEIGASAAPGWYYFDLVTTGRVVVTTDAGSVVTGHDRYLPHLVDPDAVQTKADVTGAVWDETAASHTTAGTFGESQALQIGTVLYWRLLSTIYSGTPSRPTSMVVAAYASKADADADTSRLYTMQVQQTFDAQGNLVTSSKTRI